jgi:protein O-mannosyl-transferase
MLNKININPGRQRLIVYLALIIVTCAVFWQMNQFDFINFDDNAYVTKNSHIQSGITPDGIGWAFGTKYYGLWNPLTWLSLMFDYQLHGLNAGGYHLTNLIFHVLSTLLLFWLFVRMTGAIWKSAFVAALFALHPLHVESVAWIAERKDVLSAFFWMLTLCLYVYYTEKPVIRRYWLVLFCFACALMSKPMVVTLPVVMILLDYWPLDRLQSRKIVTTMPEVIPVFTNKGKKKNKSEKEALKKNISPTHEKKLSEPKIAGIIPLWQLKEKLPFFILSAVTVFITLYAPNKPSVKHFPLSSRLANAPVAFVTYLEKTFWPHDMAIFYPFSDQIALWKVLGASLLILVISIGVTVMLKRLPYLFTGWLWYVITIAPVIGIIQISASAPYAMADRYHYLPSIGIGIMLAWGMPLLFQRSDILKKILFPAGIAVLAILSILTWKQCGYWKDSFELFGHALQVTKADDLTHHGFGRSLLMKGKIDEAIAHFNEAIRLKPDNILPYFNRGAAYAKSGRHQEAIEDYTEVIRLKPDYADAYNNRGLSFDELGWHQRAIEDYTEAIRLKPDHVNAYNNRGIAFGELGQYQRAIEDYTEAIRLKPDDADTYNYRGITYGKLDRHQMAIADYTEAIRLKPDHNEALSNRGVAYVNLNQYQRAIEDYNEAIRLKPDDADAYNNRGTTYLLQGKKKLACSDAKKACQLGNCKALEITKSDGDCH